MTIFKYIFCLVPVVSACEAHGGAGISPISSTQSAERILQAQVGDAANKVIQKAKSKIAKEVKGFESAAAGVSEIVSGMEPVAANTRAVATMSAKMQREYKDFKENFDKLRKEIEETTPEKLAAAGSNPANKDIETRAETENPSNEDLEAEAKAEKEKAEKEQKDAEEEEKNGGSGRDEPLSEAAQKAVDEERARRKKEAEDKARAEGKAPSEAVWEDLTDEEIDEIADKADGTENVSDEDRKEIEKLKEQTLGK